MSADSDKPRLLLVRRVGDGIGGAAKTLRRFEQLFAEEWRTETLCAGGLGGRVTGTKGPSWWRNLRFASTANRALPDIGADVVFTLERGVRGDLFRTADGVHARWLELSGAGLIKRLANPLHSILPRLERETFSAARRIVCQGEMIAADVRRFYPEFGDKVRIIPTGFDTARYRIHPVSREAAKIDAGLSGESGRVFLFVGSGWRIKNLDGAVAMFAEFVKRHDRDAKLLVAGAGKPSAHLGNIRALGVENSVRFLGTVADVAPLLRAADAALMPSIYDTFPNAALEAAACGAPLVLTETNGARELVKDGETGVILPHGFNPSAAAEKIAALFRRAPGAEAVAAATRGRDAANEKRLYLELLAEILAEKRAR